jgi:hypothetical protein
MYQTLQDATMEQPDEHLSQLIEADDANAGPNNEPIEHDELKA